MSAPRPALGTLGEREVAASPLSYPGEDGARRGCCAPRCRALRRETNELVLQNPGRLGSQAQLIVGTPHRSETSGPSGAAAPRARSQRSCLELFVIVPCVSILPS